jgi:hypothetical protein
VNDHAVRNEVVPPSLDAEVVRLPQPDVTDRDDCDRMGGKPPAARAIPRPIGGEANEIREILCEVKFRLTRAVDLAVASVADRDQISDVSCSTRIEPDWDDVMRVKSTATAATPLACVVVKQMNTRRVKRCPRSDGLAI